MDTVQKAPPDRLNWALFRLYFTADFCAVSQFPPWGLGLFLFRKKINKSVKIPSGQEVRLVVQAISQTLV